MAKQMIDSKSTTEPISERKRQANRLNAQKSTGPRTLIGKRNSRFNAVKHGLLAKNAIAIYYEDQREFNDLLEELRSDFQPCNVIEEILVERIADCYWKLGRIAVLTNHLMNSEPKPRQPSLLDFLRVPYFDKLQRYETAIENRLFKTLHELERLQRLRGGQFVTAPLIIESNQ